MVSPNQSGNIGDGSWCFRFMQSADNILIHRTNEHGNELTRSFCSLSKVVVFGVKPKHVVTVLANVIVGVGVCPVKA